MKYAPHPHRHQIICKHLVLPIAEPSWPEEMFSYEYPSARKIPLLSRHGMDLECTYSYTQLYADRTENALAPENGERNQESYASAERKFVMLLIDNVNETLRTTMPYATRSPAATL